MSGYLFAAITGALAALAAVNAGVYAHGRNLFNLAVAVFCGFAALICLALAGGTR